MEYVFVSNFYHPDLLGQLLGYQKLIVELAGQYKSQAWLAYDWEHRQACALDISLQWDIRNEEASFKYLKETALLPNCFSCQRVGHLRSNCPDVENPQQLKPATQNYAKSYTQASPYHYFANPQPQTNEYQSSNALSTSPNLPFRGQGANSPPAPAVITGARFCVLYNQSGYCAASCPTASHTCNRANSAQNSQGTNEPFEHLSVPLPNKIETPVNVKNLECLLIGYPFPNVANYLTTGLKQDFHLGYTGTRFEITPQNLKSALDNRPNVIEAIWKELERRHIAGPFNEPPLQPLHCSPLGAVLKKDGSWHLILDLSSPKGQSVNEQIPKDAFSVTFNTFDDAVNMVKKLRGALMGKVDIKHAFRLMPVHPEDWNLLGTCWDGPYFVELRLPFGCWSSVFIFNTLADALAWILQVKYAISLLTHYLDDFFTCGAPDSDQCAHNLSVIVDVFQHLGVPLAMDKMIGPVMLIICLGIEINSIAQEIRLPKDKFDELMSCL